jgi:3-methyladenine DNA glycosylase AlkD
MSGDRQGELRRKIAEINNNTSLTNKEKNSLIQVMKNWYIVDNLINLFLGFNE